MSAADEKKEPKVAVSIAHAEYLSSGDTLPSYGLPEFAFAGRSNVGKSSLLNALMQRKGLVRTSKHPGATRKVNLFRADVRGGPSVCFADLPGYGFANRSKTERVEWKKSLERYLLERPDLRGVVCLVDARRGVEDEELELQTFLARRPELRVACVVTKLDKLPKVERKLAQIAAEKALARRMIGTSAETGEGVEALWRWILAGTVDPS